MKIERQPLPRTTIEQFADEHDLIMEVHERHPECWPSHRYYAFFKDSLVKGEKTMIAGFGEGPTEEAAIADYARQISMCALVIDATAPARREINVPLLEAK